MTSDKAKESMSEGKKKRIEATLVRPADHSPKAIWEISRKLYEKLTGKPAADRPSQEVMEAYGLTPEDFD